MYLKKTKNKKQIKSPLKKIVPKTMNFGLPNLTKQKRKPFFFFYRINKKGNLVTQQNVTQKRILETQQNVTTFSQYFLFLAVVGLSLILLFYFL